MNELVKQGITDLAEVTKDSAEKNFLSVAKDFWDEHETGILTVGSSVLDLAGIIFAVIDGNKIMETIRIANMRLSEESGPVKRKEIYIQTAKDLMLPVGRIAAFYISSRALDIIKTRHLTKKVAELTSALSVTTAALTQAKLWNEQAKKELERNNLWKEKAKEELGDEKTDKVNSEVAKEEIKKDPPKDNLTAAPTGMWRYRLDHTGVYIWSDRSPEDIKGWQNEMSANLWEGQVFDDRIGINEFYSWLTEHMPETYRVKSFDDNDDLYWYTADKGSQKSRDLVSIEIALTEDSERRPVHVLHANFLPFHYKQY